MINGKTVVDVHMDFLPEDLFTNDWLREGFLNCIPSMYTDYSARMGEVPGRTGARQMILEKPKGYQNLNYVEGDYSLEFKITAMDQEGVDYAILRTPVWQEWLPLDLCKYVNDAAADMIDMIKRADGRMFGVATVPPWKDKENIHELERCIKDLGFKAVQLACHYGNLYLDDEAFKPLFKVINEMNVPVLVRHTPLPVDCRSIIEYNNVRKELGRVIDQSTAVCRELYSGMFDEFPNLKMIHSMFGGNFFALQNMMLPRKGAKKDALNRLDVVDYDRFITWLDNNLFFDMTHPSSWGSRLVQAAVEICGADHFLFGTSFPIVRTWVPEGIATIESLDISETDKALIFSGNANRLLNLGI